jgi:hypothetical protein
VGIVRPHTHFTISRRSTDWWWSAYAEEKPSDGAPTLDTPLVGCGRAESMDEAIRQATEALSGAAPDYVELGSDVA